jgi:uncharacterized protein (DUF58 family)
MAEHIANLHERAEALAGKLPALMIAADRVAATVSQGIHGRRRVGQGETFWQFRRYEWGDPLQKIDWRRSAKSDPIYLRETEWEAAQSVWIWSDPSNSMRYNSDKNLPEKSEHADLLALALGSLLMRGGEQITALGHGMRPTSGRHALMLLAGAMEQDKIMAERQDTTSLPPYEKVPRHGQIVMFSDFLEPLPELHAALAGYVDRGVRGHLMQILDPAEQSLPFAGRTRFEGLENEGMALIGRVEGIREAYHTTLEDHRQGLRDMAHMAGWTYSLHTTDQPLQSALLGLYTTLAGPGVT